MLTAFHRHNIAAMQRLDYPDKDNRSGCPQQEGCLHMCDYSLHHVASRPAKVGDKLVSTKFMNSTTGGFAAAGEPDVAVCLRPGTEVAFDQDVTYERGLGLILPRLGYTTIRERVARFRQIDLDRPNSHHDALEFPNGETVLLTILREGQTCTVLQLPADAEHEHKHHDETARQETAQEAAPERRTEPFTL